MERTKQLIMRGTMSEKKLVKLAVPAAGEDACTEITLYRGTTVRNMKVVSYHYNRQSVPGSA